MAGFISRESIEEVSNKTDIVQLIGERVQLTQRGRDWWGVCPFHQDKNPSFIVSPENKFYYFFICQASGTAIDFLKEMDKISFSEAVTILAKKAGVVLKYESGGSERQKEDPNAKLKEEAPVIASVFTNRLKYNIGLYSCATIEYILTEIQGLPHPEKITYKNLKINSPHNTYMRAGLPEVPRSNTETVHVGAT